MMSVTAWSAPIEDGDREYPAGRVEIRDLARGLAGALFVSLPLLFTMEMWEIAKSIPEPLLLVLLGVSLIVNRVLIEYSGYRHLAWQRSKWWDALVAMGIGIFASVVTLVVTGVIDAELDTYLAIKTIALETVPTSMGAAVAANQLGAGDAAANGEIDVSPDLDVVLGSLIGGFVFAFNIAPTVEPKVIVMQQDWVMTGATVLLSVAASYVMVAITQFEQRDLADRSILDSEWAEALVAYLLAFVISMLLLWLFGYGTPADPIQVWLPQAVVLAYATTLAGAAGRIVL